MIKGHTKIELMDVHTGKKEVVEHDNMITNAVHDLCNPPYPLLPSEMNVPAINYSKPLIESLFGGIMLWEDALNDNANDYVFPHGVGCTGYACDKANSGVNNMMGTYNASESGYQPDGSHKKVWDFSTAQANGIISSLSLVPTMTGNVGWGVTEYDSRLEERRDGYIAIGINDDGKLYHSDRVLYVKDGYVYAIKQYNLYYDSNHQNLHISRNGGKLIIQKYLIPSKQISLFAKYNYLKFVEEFEVQLPSDFVASISTSSNYYYGMCMYDDRSESINLIIMGERSVVNAGGTIKLCRIGISAYTSSTYDISFPVSVVFTRIQTNNQGYDLYASIYGNKLVVTEYGANNIVIIDISGSSNVKEIACPGDRCRFVISDIQNGYLYLCVQESSSLRDDHIYLLDVDSAELERLTADGMSDSTSSYNQSPLFNRMYMGVKVVGSKIHNFKSGLGYMYPFYHIMLTKNNLDSPVTKTPDKTMKITYTLTEA